MLNINDYQLPDRPTVEDYDTAKALESAMQTWQKQAQREWNRLIRDAQRESFSVTRFNAQIRAVVLILVVLAIVIMPLIALLQGTLLNAFTQLIAPVTGIGGVIIGYWFGQSKDDSAAIVATRRAGKSDSDPEEANETL